MDTSKFYPPDTKFTSACVGVRRYKSNSDHSALLLCKDSSSDVLGIHLTDANEVQSRVLNGTGGCFITVPSLSDIESIMIGLFAKRISKLPKRKLQYGFTSPTEFEEVNGEILATSSNAVGLTCATFVLMAFERIKKRLVKYETWPAASTEDEAVQTYAAEHYALTPEHAEQMKKEIGNPRYSPLQVCAAPLCATPASYNDVNDVVAEIEPILQAEFDARSTP